MKGYKFKKILTILFGYITITFAVDAFGQIYKPTSPPFEPAKPPSPYRPAMPQFFESPASFRNVTYKVHPNVVKISRSTGTTILNNLKVPEEIIQNKTISTSPKNKLKNGALIPSQLFSQLRSQIQLQRGTILFDPDNKVAFKVMGESIIRGTNYIILTRPEIHEVLEEFVIPAQTVIINKGNIIPLTPKEVQFIYTTPRAGSIQPYSGEMWHIRDPWLKLEFNNVPLVAYTKNGATVSVILDGRIGLTPINVEGSYSCFGGYKFIVWTGEEISLKVTVNMDLREDLKIPLFAIDIPAGIASVRGGIYLLVGMDGKFTLWAEATEWLEASAGVNGGTFLCIPTGFNPQFDLNKGFDARASFLGAISGYVKGGPLLELELLGFDLVGAGALAGMGVDVEAKGSILEADIYGSLEIFATLIGKRINFVNNTFMLYQMQRPNTSGYEINFYEACAYRGIIRGNIKKDEGGRLNPVRNASITLKVDHNGQQSVLYGLTNEEGDFTILTSQYKLYLYKGDKIYIEKIGNDSIPGSLFIEPTFPFKHIHIEFADFFNDFSKGYISPAIIKDQSTGVVQNLYYTGQICYNTGGCTYADSNGNFVLNYDFKPNQRVIVSVEYNGFRIESQPVDTDTRFSTKRLIEPLRIYTYRDSEGRPVEGREQKEYFLISNLRGTKSILALSKYTAEYYLFTSLSYVRDYFTDSPIMPPKLLGDKTFNVNIFPYSSAGSKMEHIFQEEWLWAPQTITLPSKPNITSQWFSQQFYSSDVFRYNSNRPYESRSPDEGVKAILRKGHLTFSHEGFEIELIPQEDGEEHKGHGYPKVTVDPGTIELRERIWSKVNPLIRETIERMSDRINPSPIFFIERIRGERIRGLPELPMSPERQLQR